MPWVKLADGFPDHPKVLEVGGDAAWLHVCALCYCGKHLTDGRFHRSLVGRLSDRDNTPVLADELVRVGLWAADGDYYRINDYLSFNPSKADVLDARERRAVAGRKGAESRWHGISHGSPHAERIDNVNAPDPSRPEGSKEPLGAISSPPPRKKRGTPFPESFSPGDAGWDWAAEHCPSIDVEMSTKQFAAFWRGDGRVKADWSQTWRNWLLKDEERAKPGPNGRQATRTHL